MIGLRVTFLDLNNNYSRRHYADANDAFATMSFVVVFVALIGDQLFGHLYCHQRSICGFVFHPASKMSMLLTVN